MANELQDGERTAKAGRAAGSGADAEGLAEPARKLTRMGVTARRAAVDSETMRILAAVFVLCVLAPAAAGRPVAVLAADVVVDRHAHVARASTIVVDDASQVLDRRYRTTLRYRCADRWLTARRIARGPASATITWRYPARLAGKRCSFRIIVERIGEPHQARSAILRRAL